MMEKVVTCIYDRVLLLNSYMIYWSVIHIRTFDNLCGKKYQFTSIKWKNKCCSIIDMSSLHVLNITGVPLTFLGCPMDLKDQWRVSLQSFINCLFSIDIEVYSWYHDSRESGLLRVFSCNKMLHQQRYPWLSQGPGILSQGCIHVLRIDFWSHVLKFDSLNPSFSTWESLTKN